MTNEERLEALQSILEFRNDPTYGNGHDQTIRTRAIKIMIDGYDLPGTKETDRFLHWCIRLVEDQITVAKYIDTPEAEAFLKADRLLWQGNPEVEGD